MALKVELKPFERIIIGQSLIPFGHADNVFDQRRGADSAERDILTANANRR
jgi:hypothetical protein